MQRRLSHEACPPAFDAAWVGPRHRVVGHPSDTVRWDDGMRRLFGVLRDAQVSHYTTVLDHLHEEDRERVSYRTCGSGSISPSG